MSWKNQEDIWGVLENAPDYAIATADLISWSTNYNFGDSGNPFKVFLILSGFNEETYGEETGTVGSLAWVETAKLSAALAELSARPLDVLEFVKVALDKDN